MIDFLVMKKIIQVKERRDMVCKHLQEYGLDMSDNTTKWLCVGGVLSGEWREQQLEAFDVDPNDLNTHSYEPMKLINPVTKAEQHFYVYTELQEQAYERAINFALYKNQ